MFEFGEADYKWCSSCRGNVRRDAYFCRYCHTPLGSKLLKDKKAERVSTLFDEASKFLPRWSTIVESLLEPLRNRIAEADLDPVEGFLLGKYPGLTPQDARELERNNDEVGMEPPREVTLGFIYDMLLALSEVDEAKLRDVCTEKRMELLEITFDDVLTESEFRKADRAGNYRCKQCDEYIAKSSEQCRFCGGSETQKPSQQDRMMSMTFGTTDEKFTRDIILFEAAAQRIDRHNEVQHEKDSQVTEEMLKRWNISTSEIDHEVIRQKSDPTQRPARRWRTRMKELGLRAFDSHDSLKVHDLQMVAMGLQHDNRHIESLVVMYHALNRWANDPQFSARKSMFQTSLATTYMAMGNNEKYQEMRRTAISNMPESLQENSRLADKTLGANLFNMHSKKEEQEEKDPVEAHDELVKSLEEIRKESQERLKQFEDKIPGISKMIESLHSRTLDRSMTVNRTVAEGQSAMKKGDYSTAIEKFSEVVAVSEPSEALGGFRKSAAYCDLGEAFCKNGQLDRADESFRAAIQLGQDMVESQMSTGLELAGSSLRYAEFLRDNDRLADAKEAYAQAIDAHITRRKLQQIKHNTKPEAFASTDATLKESYAKFLDKAGLIEEAKSVREEVTKLNAIAAEFDAKNQQNRRNFMEGLPRID